MKKMMSVATCSALCLWVGMLQAQYNAGIIGPFLVPSGIVVINSPTWNNQNYVFLVTAQNSATNLMLHVQTYWEGYNYQIVIYNPNSTPVEAKIHWFYAPTTGIAEGNSKKDMPPYSYNTPNPFHGFTEIHYEVKNKPQHVSLKIYDIKGRLMRTLIDKVQEPMTYLILWDGKDDRGYDLSGGTYFYQLEIGKEQLIKKMILLK